jgi:hypothetical protein
MRFRQVEVDNDVFQFVKTHAEPLVDTFNSALRCLLPMSDTQTQKNHVVERDPGQTDTAGALPSVPRHLPQALKHILEVVRLVRGGAYTRTTATQYVARQYKVFPQTVLDKYCRQLSLTAAQFDRLLEEPGLGELRKKLKGRFSGHAQAIDEVLKK